MNAMNVGEQILDWLYREQLQVDEQWAVRNDRGFTWWAHENAQTVEILREETGPDGQVGYLIGIRTEMVTDFDLTESALTELNHGPLRLASMSGPVYDSETRTLSLRSLGRVHEQTAEWMGVLLGTAAVTQLAEARMLGHGLAEAVGARPAVSGHPQNGHRAEPDEMILAAQVLVRAGQEPCQWPEADFTAAVEQFMRQPPAVLASSGGQALTVEFPYGDGSSLCQILGTQNHPLYGHGLLVLQRFPFTVESEAKGAELALTLNATELAQDSTGFAFGSYVHDSGMICYSGFVSNALHRQVILPNLYFACAVRAQAMSIWLLDKPWNDESFTIEHSAAGRNLMSGNGDA